jgi:hypothetical protein
VVGLANTAGFIENRSWMTVAGAFWLVEVAEKVKKFSRSNPDGMYCRRS